MGTARLQNDPYRYVRRVKGGRWQARPFDLGERYNLGLFPTREQAARAVTAFWWGRYPDRPKFVRPVRRRDGSVSYRVIVRFAGWTDRLGDFPDQAAAAAATRDFVLRTYGPLFAPVILTRRG